MPAVGVDGSVPSGTGYTCRQTSVVALSCQVKCWKTMMMSTSVSDVVNA